MQTSVFICQKIKHLPFIVYVQYYDDREIKGIITSNESEFGLLFPILFHAIIINYTIDFFWKKELNSPMKMNEESGEKGWENLCLFFIWIFKAFVFSEYFLLLYSVLNLDSIN